MHIVKIFKADEGLLIETPLKFLDLYYLFTTCTNKRQILCQISVKNEPIYTLFTYFDRDIVKKKFLKLVGENDNMLSAGGGGRLAAEWVVGTSLGVNSSGDLAYSVGLLGTRWGSVVLAGAPSSTVFVTLRKKLPLKL